MRYLKGVLEEELSNSLAMQAGYEKQLAALPQGALVKKKIKGGEYYYLVYRVGGKVRFDYKGKNISEDEIRKYKEAKDYRARYRNLLSEVRKQVKFLKGTLRGKRAV